MEHGDYASPGDAMIHQAPNHLEEGVDLRLLRSRRPVALVHWRCIEVEADVRGQGRVGVTPEVESLLLPPLIETRLLHGDVFIHLALAQLDHAAADERRCRLTLPNRLEEDGGAEVVPPQSKVGLDAQIALA
jgi:hypothetical protein